MTVGEGAPHDDSEGGALLGMTVGEGGPQDDDKGGGRLLALLTKAEQLLRRTAVVICGEATL